MMNFEKAQEIFTTFYPNGTFEVRNDVLMCSTNTFTYRLNGTIEPRYSHIYHDIKDTEEFYFKVLQHFGITVYSKCNNGQFNVQFGEGTEWVKV